MKNRIGILIAHGRRHGFALKVILTLLLMALIMRGIDWPHVVQLLRRQDGWLVALAMVLGMVQIAFGALRWHLILQALAGKDGVRMRLPLTCKLYYISIFFNSCLPGGTMGGDVMRVWLTKAEQVPLPLAIHSVVIDRIIALAALLIMIAFDIPFIAAKMGFSPWPPMLLLLAGTIIGLVFLYYAERLLARFQSWPPVRWLLYFIASLRLLLHHPVASIVSLAYALLAHGGFCLAVYVLAHSMGIGLSVADCFILMPLVMLAAIMPISIGGWGLREAGMVGTLALIGIPKVIALTLSVQLGLVNIFISLPGGLLWLAHRKSAPPSSLLSVAS